MQVRAIPNIHIMNMKFSYEIRADDTIARVLTIENDLELNSVHPQYDRAALDDLLNQVQHSLGDLFDKAKLRQVTGDT